MLAGSNWTFVEIRPSRATLKQLFDNLGQLRSSPGAPRGQPGCAESTFSATLEWLYLLSHHRLPGRRNRGRKPWLNCARGSQEGCSGVNHQMEGECALSDAGLLLERHPRAPSRGCRNAVIAQHGGHARRGGGRSGAFLPSSAEQDADVVRAYRGALDNKRARGWLAHVTRHPARQWRVRRNVGIRGRGRWSGPPQRSTTNGGTRDAVEAGPPRSRGRPHVQNGRMPPRTAIRGA